MPPHPPRTVYNPPPPQTDRHALCFEEQKGTLCVSKFCQRRLVLKKPQREKGGSIISQSWLIQRHWRKEKKMGGGVSRARVFSLGCVVYKQTWRKQSSEECDGRGKG